MPGDGGGGGAFEPARDLAAVTALEELPGRGASENRNFEMSLTCC